VIALAGIAVLALAVASSPAAKRNDIGFSGVPPSPAYEGQTARIAVYVRPASPRCTLTIRYTGGRTDRRVQAAPKGRAEWNIRIPAVPPGQAAVTVTCKGAGTVRGTMLVQWPLQTPLLSAGKSGWSQRNQTFGTSSDVSYGVAVKNERARFDAVNVAVLVNFVDDANRVLGSARNSLSRIPAGGTFYLGGSLSIPTQTPIARLEIVVGPATSAQIVPSQPPLISDVAIVPARDGTYVDSVRGQLLNTYQFPMQSARLGIVLLDSSGNIVGGGQTTAQGPIAKGARVLFVATSSFRAIPLSRASTGLISAVPTYLLPR
jgi:hypothetical protein